MVEKNTKNVKVVTENRKAYHDFFIEETYEAGIVLTGTEVKSLRAGKANLKDSYAQVQNGEMFLYNMHISPYEQGNRYNVDPVRPRKLLLHKKEIISLMGKVMQQGLTLIPLKVYFQRGRAKVALALARGKKLYDKRAAMAERDARREMERAARGKE
ncbi:MAG TPA: SsrA-binding protein SmpB [Peptococcaceae bacterium]|jgi:SsrA-binding protein|nr:SsrA-binding protein SmpB [Peptococcaceae bacterium]HPZ72141.1 SsrA-binding protein SmpB [Peptococcaceae bacterium]HQD54827.1 SsrA-binding protein SmpB [Peptococcaceae bacterium]